MTLVLVYANTDFVTIAADRRITTSTGGLMDDTFTKTAIIYNRFIFGFTGLAQIGTGRHTMEWLVKTIASQNGLYPDKLAQAAATEVAKLHIPSKWKRLAFAGVGYDESDKLTYVLITNMHDAAGAVLAQATDTFRVFVDKPAVRSTIRAIGQPLPKSVQRSLLTSLRSSHHDNLPSIDAVHAMLAGAIEKAASKTVSSTALLTSLKRTGGGTFDVVTPNSKPGQTVSLASPFILFPNGAIVTMPQQMLRRSKMQK
jgi:hypothetical protein